MALLPLPPLLSLLPPLPMLAPLALPPPLQVLPLPQLLPPVYLPPPASPPCSPPGSSAGVTDMRARNPAPPAADNLRRTPPVPYGAAATKLSKLLARASAADVLSHLATVSCSERVESTTWTSGADHPQEWHARVGVRPRRRNPVTRLSGDFMFSGPLGPGADEPDIWYAEGRGRTARAARQQAELRLVVEHMSEMPPLFVDIRPTISYVEVAALVLRQESVSIVVNDVPRLRELANREGQFGFDSEGRPAHWAQFAFLSSRVVCIVARHLPIVDELMQSAAYTKLVFDVGSEDRALGYRIADPVVDIQHRFYRAFPYAHNASLSRLVERGWLLHEFRICDDHSDLYAAFGQSQAAALSQRHRTYAAADAWFNAAAHEWLSFLPWPWREDEQACFATHSAARHFTHSRDRGDSRLAVQVLSAAVAQAGQIPRLPSRSGPPELVAPEGPGPCALTLRPVAPVPPFSPASTPPSSPSEAAPSPAASET